MSHDATNWAIKQKGLKPAAKVVLWHLADRFHPDHGCFPSKETLAEDCEMSERSVYNQILILEEAGLLVVDKVENKSASGKWQSNRYILACDPEFRNVKQSPSANSAVGKSVQKPSANSGKNRGQILPTNLVRETGKETGKEKTDTDLFKAEEITLPKWLNLEVWNDYCSYKRKKSKVALSKRLKGKLLNKLKEIHDAGKDPNAALDLAMERGWIGFEVEHVLNANLAKRPNANAGQRDPNDPMAGLPDIIAQAIRSELDPTSRLQMAKDYWARRECAK